VRAIWLGLLLASGCYGGHARSTSSDQLSSADRWELVVGVPEVRQVTREGCGAAALAMVLGYWGLPATRDEVWAATTPPPEQGIRAAALRDFARGQGLQAFLVEGQLGDLDREVREHRPVLVGLMKVYGQRAYAHYEVVVGINHPAQRILTLDPANGLRENGFAAFQAEWAAARRVTLVAFPAKPSPPGRISPSPP
jgi:ABC-type bacteriocin/lantibiotic exporter with double-glycine peptidase domain